MPTTIEQIDAEIKRLQEQREELIEKLERKPRIGLFGRWADHGELGRVLIACNEPDEDGEVWVQKYPGYMSGEVAPASWECLTFPEETLRPEDVHTGEVWEVNIDDDGDVYTNFIARKASSIGSGVWQTFASDMLPTSRWLDDHITLLHPVVPAMPGVSIAEDSAPNTVTTEAEYAALPEGSVVRDGVGMYLRKEGVYFALAQTGAYYKPREMAEFSSIVMYRGEGDE